MATQAATEVVNVNVGVLGHVDSGKTHLVRVLSTHLSTAALDKHPQSQVRGMTLDLGFSSFRLPSPTKIPNGPEIQITLVDCPGHASLFKTILGGVHIIDSVLLVVDIQKGLQPQTIECLLLTQLAAHAQVIVALNKIDLIPKQERAKRIRQVESDIRTFLQQSSSQPQDQSTPSQTKNIPIIPVAAAPGNSSCSSGDAEASGSLGSPLAAAAIGIDCLVEALQEALRPVPKRDASGPLCYAIDHCFAIQGNGTILTGTVLSGTAQVGDAIAFPKLHVLKTIKSMQMFKKSVTRAIQGDRVALRVNGLDASLVERGLAITPGSLTFVNQVVIDVSQIAFFQGICKSGAKFHATIGHTTVVAVATFFKPRLPQQSQSQQTLLFDPRQIYQAVKEIESVSQQQQQQQQQEADGDTTATRRSSGFHGFALLQFEQPVICPPQTTIVCSRLDLDPKQFHCRLAFHGHVQAIVHNDQDPDQEPEEKAASIRSMIPSLRLSELQIGTVKERSGVVDKVVVQKDAANTVVEHIIAKEMFARDVDWQVYINCTVLFTRANVVGKIVGPFGKSGKFRIELLGQERELAGRLLPVVGEKIVLRFIKLTTVRPLPRMTTTKSNTSSTTSARPKSRKLIQDDRILYTEAFLATTSVESSQVEGASLSSPPPLPPRALEVSQESREDGDADAAGGGCVVHGRIERLKGETTAEGRNPFVIVTGLFSDEPSARAAVGHPVRCVLVSAGSITEMGEIEKPFGKAGKVSVIFPLLGGTLAKVGDLVEYHSVV